MKTVDAILIFIGIWLLTRKAAAATDTAPAGVGLPRGLKNNNPGNLKISGNDWIGKIPIDRNTDGAFEQFESMDMGIRAAILTIISYMERRNLTTIREILNRWAPGSENPTNNYINYVSQCSGIEPDRELRMDKVELSRVLRCMFVFENGVKYANLIPSNQEIVRIWNNYI